MNTTPTMGTYTFSRKELHAVTPDGGGGFFLACEDFGGMFDHSLPACAFFFFFYVEIRSHTLI